MVNKGEGEGDLVVDELGRTIFKVEAAIALLYSGKVIPAHEKLQGIKRILVNLRAHILKSSEDVEAQSDK